MRDVKTFLLQQIELRKEYMRAAEELEGMVVSAAQKDVCRHVYTLENGGRNALEWALKEWLKLEKK